MKQLKKLVLTLLCVTVLCGLTACGTNEDDKSGVTDNTTTGTDNNTGDANDTRTNDATDGTRDDGVVDDIGDDIREGADRVGEDLNGTDDRTDGMDNTNAPEDKAKDSTTNQ